MTNHELPILDDASTLADLTRCRILQLVGRHELTVGELCTVLQTPQSTVSRHLKVLADGSWVQVRRQGRNHLYRLIPERLAPGALRLWRLLHEQMAGTAIEAQDRQRLETVLAARRERSEAFFSSTVKQWDHMRDALFGDRFELLALLALLDRRWVVGDLACGTGPTAAALAPFVHRVIAIDGSSAMLDAARTRLAGTDNVDLRAGVLEQLPLDDHSLDAATLILALHHVADPSRVLREVRRVLRPGGRLLLVDMTPHEREAYRQEMGHIWLGFSDDEIDRELAAAGFRSGSYQTLPASAEAQGPALFVAVGIAADDDTTFDETNDDTDRRTAETALPVTATATDPV